jgi:hypothetical protein
MEEPNNCGQVDSDDRNPGINIPIANLSYYKVCHRNGTSQDLLFRKRN